MALLLTTFLFVQDGCVTIPGVLNSLPLMALANSLQKFENGYYSGYNQ